MNKKHWQAAKYIQRGTNNREQSQSSGLACRIKLKTLRRVSVCMHMCVLVSFIVLQTYAYVPYAISGSRSDNNLLGAALDQRKDCQRLIKYRQC